MSCREKYKSLVASVVENKGMYCHSRKLSARIRVLIIVVPEKCNLHWDGEPEAVRALDLAAGGILGRRHPLFCPSFSIVPGLGSDMFDKKVEKKSALPCHFLGTQQAAV